MRQPRATVIVIAAFLVLVTPFPLLAAPTESSSAAEVDLNASQEQAEFNQRASKGTETGVAACYNGRPKWWRHNGQQYKPRLTAAHATIPMGTHVKVTNLENGQSVVVLVNDRMSSGRIIIDISKQVCKELGLGRAGEAKVKLEIETSGKYENDNPFGPPFDTQTAVQCQRATCPYFTQIFLGDAKFRAAIDRLLTDAELKKDTGWFPEAIVDSPIVPIRHQGNDYIAASVCEAHDCTNHIDVLYRPNDGHLTLLYVTHVFKPPDCWRDFGTTAGTISFGRGCDVVEESKLLGGTTEFEQLLFEHFDIVMFDRWSKVYPVEIELLPPLAADSVLSLKSQDSNTPTTVNFVNSSGDPVDVCWVSYDGARVLYKHLAPDESCVVQTYVTHPWAIYDDRISSYIAGFLPVKSTAQAVISLPSHQPSTGKPNTPSRSDSGCQANDTTRKLTH